MVKTRVLKITRQMPEWESVKVAARVIERGGIVCFPTDTIYGFAASIYCEPAMERLRKIKGRGEHEPFVVIAADVDIASELVAGVTREHRRLIDAYWPGALTIVFAASARVPEYAVGQKRTVALRVPNDPLTQSILRGCGLPLAAPSANLRGRSPALSPAEVLEDFDGRIDLLLDGGPTSNPEPSTIVAVRSHRLEILRQGKILLGRAAR
jgi:L-threonylcarbamoyladenylate synthase